ncbi:MAG: tRNA pseudouridine(55) synthase TruB [Armatimonadota bacterium]
MLDEGFVNLLKPPGMTSHDAVAWLRSQLGIRRIGHLGTLDPAAAGVLPLSLGRATRLFAYAAGSEKAYRAEIVFGIETDTLDAEGAITSVSDASSLSESSLRALLERFVGELEQTTPAFSAVSVGGRRLHQQARAGAGVAGPRRRVTIASLELVGFEPGPRASALVDIVCGPGTYIRALADDLGKAAGCGACLGFLVRTRAGRFTLCESATLEEISERVAAGTADQAMLPPDWPLASLPEVLLDPPGALGFVHGNTVSVSEEPSDRVRVYAPGPLFLGLGEVLSGQTLHPRLVLRSADELPV